MAHIGSVQKLPVKWLLGAVVAIFALALIGAAVGMFDLTGTRRAAEEEAGRRAAAPARDPAALCKKAIPVTVRPGRDVRLDHDDPYQGLVPPECRATFEVRRGQVFISTGGRPRVELGVGKGKHFPFRPPVVLSGNGTAMVILTL